MLLLSVGFQLCGRCCSFNLSKRLQVGSALCTFLFLSQSTDEFFLLGHDCRYKMESFSIRTIKALFFLAPSWSFGTERACVPFIGLFAVAVSPSSSPTYLHYECAVSLQKEERLSSASLLDDAIFVCLLSLLVFFFFPPLSCLCCSFECLDFIRSLTSRRSDVCIYVCLCACERMCLFVCIAVNLLQSNESAQANTTLSLWT